MTTIEFDDISSLPRMLTISASTDHNGSTGGWTQVLVDAFASSGLTGGSAVGTASDAMPPFGLAGDNASPGEQTVTRGGDDEGAVAMALQAWELAGDRLALSALSAAAPVDEHWGERRHAEVLLAGARVSPRTEPSARRNEVGELPRFHESAHEGLGGHASRRNMAEPLRVVAMALAGVDLTPNSPAPGVTAATQSTAAAGSSAKDVTANAKRRLVEPTGALCFDLGQSPLLHRIATRFAPVLGKARIAATKRRRRDLDDDDAVEHDPRVVPLDVRGQGPWLRRVTHAYVSREGVMLWVRDAHLTRAGVDSLIAALRRWATATGLQLAVVVCNGKVVYRSANADATTAPIAAGDSRSANGIN